MREHKPTGPCRACKAEIAFVVTRKGKHMPVDAGSLSAEDLELLSRVGEKVPFRYGDHISHFATCPQAGEFRR